MIDLTPKQRVFEMLASLARIVNDSPDLNAERHRLATLVEHSRSWETQLMNVPESAAEPQETPMAESQTGLYMTVRRGLWDQQLSCLDALAPYIPKRRARKLRRKVLVALRTSVVDGDVFGDRARSTGGTDNLVVEVRVAVMDQLIAAALRAAKAHF